MFNFFKKSKPTEKCSFCSIEVDRSNSFVLQYKSADGLGNMTVCKECSKVFNEIIDMRDSVNEETDD